MQRGFLMRHMKYALFAAALAAQPTAYAPAASAACLMREQGEMVEVLAQECRKLSPLSDPEIAEHAGAQMDPTRLSAIYKGALIKEANGKRWVYPSQAASPCDSFPLGKTVRMRAYYTCCDTGKWGKCVFGGAFLGDLDGTPVNAFQ
jgi:hypothetical protein